MSTLGVAFPGTRTTGETLYRTPSGKIFTDVGTLEDEYDIDGSVPDFDAVLQDFERRNVQARAQLRAHFGIPYGPTVDERLDVFPGPAGGPVIVFIHGGYWRSRQRPRCPGDRPDRRPTPTLGARRNVPLCPLALQQAHFAVHRA